MHPPPASLRRAPHLRMLTTWPLQAGGPRRRRRVRGGGRPPAGPARPAALRGFTWRLPPHTALCTDNLPTYTCPNSSQYRVLHLHRPLPTAAPAAPLLPPPEVSSPYRRTAHPAHTTYPLPSSQSIVPSTSPAGAAPQANEFAFVRTAPTPPQIYDSIARPVPGLPRRVSPVHPSNVRAWCTGSQAALGPEVRAGQGPRRKSACTKVQACHA